MIALGIVLSHLVGDYIFQTDAMAQRKTSSWFWALMHGIGYTLAYALLNMTFVLTGLSGFSWWGLLIIGGTHVVIDRYRLVKPLIWGINNIPGVTPKSARYSWAEGKANGGYGPKSPAWMSTWLMIIVDNTIHLVINTLTVYLLWKGWA